MHHNANLHPSLRPFPSLQNISNNGAETYRKFAIPRPFKIGPETKNLSRSGTAVKHTFATQLLHSGTWRDYDVLLQRQNMETLYCRYPMRQRELSQITNYIASRIHK